MRFSNLEIPCEEFVLDNGLRVVDVHDVDVSIDVGQRRGKRVDAALGERGDGRLDLHEVAADVVSVIGAQHVHHDRPVAHRSERTARWYRDHLWPPATDRTCC